MEASFWHQRWESNKIGFHEKQTNPMLVKHFDKLLPPKNSRIFLPLCGKTKDIAWLLARDYQVVGVELSSIAVAQLFEDLSITPTITQRDKLIHYHHQQLDIFVGDIFDLTDEIVGHIDAIYDRAALVALPEETRFKYAPHLIQITSNAPQLLICLQYDQSLHNGPPFSIHAAEVRQHYANSYQIDLVEEIEVPLGLKGKYDETESAWILRTV